MNVNINTCLINNLSFLFKEKIINSLTSQQKKIFAAVAFAFGCLAAAFAIRRTISRPKTIDIQDKERIEPHSTEIPFIPIFTHSKLGPTTSLSQSQDVQDIKPQSIAPISSPSVSHQHYFTFTKERNGVFAACIKNYVKSTQPSMQYIEDLTTIPVGSTLFVFVMELGPRVNDDFDKQFEQYEALSNITSHFILVNQEVTLYICSEKLKPFSGRIRVQRNYPGGISLTQPEELKNILDNQIKLDKETQ